MAYSNILMMMLMMMMETQQPGTMIIKKKLYRMRATRMDVNCEYCLDELMESLHRIPIKFANGV